MRRYDTVFFDLDGTLTDSGPGIINGVVYALGGFGITEEKREKLAAFVGPPLRDSFSRFYGLSRDESEEAVRLYREYYNDKGVYENSVYPGIEEALNALLLKGYTLAVATSKPEELSNIVLDHFGISHFFKTVSGASPDGSLESKADVIRQAVARLKLKDTNGIIMVGDRKHDVFGAKETGIPSIGVLYGYGDRKELEEAGADHIAETPADIVRIITGEQI